MFLTNPRPVDSKLDPELELGMKGAKGIERVETGGAKRESWPQRTSMCICI